MAEAAAIAGIARAALTPIIPASGGTTARYTGRKRLTKMPQKWWRANSSRTVAAAPSGSSLRASLVWRNAGPTRRAKKNIVVAPATFAPTVTAYTIQTWSESLRAARKAPRAAAVSAGAGGGG